MINRILRIKITLFVSIIVLQEFMIYNICISSTVDHDIAVLVLAHGGPSTKLIKSEENKYDKLHLWNKMVIDAVKPLGGKYNIEIAFGMADPETIQAAIDRLEENGPNDPIQNEKWLKEMMILASFVKEKGDFKDVRVTTLRDDAPKEIREKATMVLRKMVIMVGLKGNVIVIPHLIARGGIETGIPERLKGLNYIYNGKTLLPHENITRWIDLSITHALKE